MFHVLCSGENILDDKLLDDTVNTTVWGAKVKQQ